MEIPQCLSFSFIRFKFSWRLCQVHKPYAWRLFCFFHRSCPEKYWVNMVISFWFYWFLIVTRYSSLFAAWRRFHIRSHCISFINQFMFLFHVIFMKLHQHVPMCLVVKCGAVLNWWFGDTDPPYVNSWWRPEFCLTIAKYLVMQLIRYGEQYLFADSAVRHDNKTVFLHVVKRYVYFCMLTHDEFQWV